MIDSRVIVSCAGSGKTQKLIDRLISLLTSGARPGEILIITFTNKAAAEIRARLLAALAQSSNTALADCRRRILLATEPADVLTVHTFHSWFLTLSQNRPWRKRGETLPQLRADTAVIFADSWRQFVMRAEQNPSSALATVLSELSPVAVRQMCAEFKNNRNAFAIHPPSSPPMADVVVLQTALQTAAANFAQHAAGDGAIFTKAQAAAQRLSEAATTAAEEKIYFFTATDEVRKNLQQNAVKNGYLPFLQALTEALQNILTAEEERRAEEFNHAALTVCADFDTEWRAVLAVRNEMTFDDLELDAHYMLRKKNMRGELARRLCVRYRHILIDEFQDTSPMQWQIVRGWLLDSHGTDEQPSVFIVGDAKQAIYGFRHGDWRLLGEAEDFLQTYYGAQKRPPEDTCYRCAENILAMVNATFNEHRLSGFRPHKIGDNKIGGRVEWHAWCAADKSVPSAHIRNPLITRAVGGDDVQTSRAAAVAAKVDDILRTWQIKDKNGETRACRPEDILILMPRLTHVAAQTDALAAKNIDCAVGGGALDSFECADVLDLIAVLLSPTRDYSLARVLKSPIFALSDETLMEIAAIDGESWWEKLQRHSAHSSRRARVLLKLWRRRAATTLLPAHDFLSRLFVQGAIVERYRAAVSPPLRRRVRDNLSRLLDLSLQMEGGARPLLSQFLYEIRRREFVAPPPSAVGVRLMTIHAAKGLQAPVTVLADADFSQSGGRGNSADILVHWSPDEAVPARFVVSLRRYRRAYGALKAEAQAREDRERANLLYVAMTRAEQGLVIFSPAEPKGVAAWLLAAMRQLSSPSDRATELTFGENMQIAAPSSPPSLSPVVGGAQVSVGYRQSHTAAAVYGEIRHQIMALLLSGAPQSAVRQLVAAEPAQWQEALHLADSPALKQLLKSSRAVLIERDFAVDGKIIRPDLVVVRDDAVWIVDYKTGAVAPASHRRQLENYRHAVVAEYPGRQIRLAVLDKHGNLHDLDKTVAE